MRVGDCLVIEAPFNFHTKHGQDPEFYLIKQIENSKPPRLDSKKDNIRRLMTILSMISLIVLFAALRIPLIFLNLCFIFIHILNRTVTFDEVMSSLGLFTFLMPAAALTISDGLYNSGVIDWFTTEMLDAFG